MHRPHMIKEHLSLKSGKIRIHFVDAKDGNKRGGWYRQVRAKEGMLNRSLNRWFDHWNKKEDYDSSIIFRSWTEVDARLYNQARERAIKDYDLEYADNVYPLYETINHDSTWDFFDFIGYDYKNKSVKNTDTLIFIEEIKK